MSTTESQEKSAEISRTVLTIPERDLEIVDKILNLGDNIREGIWAAIDEAPLGVSDRDLASRIRAKTSLPPAQVAEIVSLLSRMYLTKARSDDLKPTEFVDAVFRAFPASKQVELGERLRNIVQKLLSFDRILGIGARAGDLSGEYEHVLHAVRVLTDIRPIFDPGPDASLSATLIVHNLRLRYSDETGQLKDFIIALDGDDLRKLGAAVERASKKEAEIRAFLAKSGMPCIALTDDT
jgi:hypothetical protein